MIKIDVEMPASCDECGFICLKEHECVIIRKMNQNRIRILDPHIWDYEKAEEKPDWCPLIEEKEKAT